MGPGLFSSTLDGNDSGLEENYHAKGKVQYNSEWWILSIDLGDHLEIQWVHAWTKNLW